MLYSSTWKNVTAMSLGPLHTIVVNILHYFWWEIFLTFLYCFLFFKKVSKRVMFEKEVFILCLLWKDIFFFGGKEQLTG